jgi:hypothetical protein
MPGARKAFTLGGTRNNSRLVGISIVLATVLAALSQVPPASASSSWSQTSTISWSTAPTSAKLYTCASTCCETTTGTWCFSLQDNQELASALFQVVVMFDSSNTHSCLEAVEVYWGGTIYSQCQSGTPGYTDKYQFYTSGTFSGSGTSYTVVYSSASVYDVTTSTYLTMPTVSYPTFNNVAAVWFQLYPFCYGNSCTSTFAPSTVSSSTTLSLTGFTSSGVVGVVTAGCESNPSYCSVNTYFPLIAGTTPNNYLTLEGSNLQCYSVSSGSSTTTLTWTCAPWKIHHGKVHGQSLPIGCQITGSCTSGSAAPASQKPQLSNQPGVSMQPVQYFR